MADNFNHNSVDCTNELINLSLHQDPGQDSAHDYYRIINSMNDYSAIYKKHNWSEADIKAKELNITGRFNRKLFQEHQEALSVASVRSNLETAGKHIWETAFYMDSYAEDNDTSEDEEVEEEEDSLY